MGMEWDNKYSVGVPSMDEQHKKLFAMMAELNAKMKEGKATDIADTLLKRLVEYAATHLTAEENLQRANSYSGYAEHKKMHDDLREQIKKHQEEVAKQPLVGVLKLSTFLYNWLTGHILKEDKKYGQELAPKGVK